MIKTPEYEAERAAAAKWEKTRRAKDRYAAEPDGAATNGETDTEPSDPSEPELITKPPKDISGAI